MNDFFTNLRTYLGDTIFNILNGIIAIVIGFIVVKFLKFIMKRIFLRLPINTTIASFLNSILSALIYLFYILIVLNAFGLDTTGVIALVGSVGVAIGLALKDSLSNIANGILLVTTKPFNVGDFVNINGVEGSVVSINMISTVLQTTDNKIVTIPNNEILSNNIINYNAMTTRRLDLVVSVSYDSDIKKVKDVINEIVTNEELIIKDPAPVFELNELADSSLNFTLRVWVNSSDYAKLKWKLNETIVKVFAKENIEIPYNKLDVNIRNN